MIEICEKNSCTGCGACSHSCPKNCIDLKENNEGFLYPVIDSDICVECGKCKKVCPINNLPEKNLSKFYMGWNRDDKTTMKSSSGGVFSALAKTIFDMNGVVFGASQKYNPNYVYHTVVKSYDELDKIRLSKYNQSDLKDTFVEVKDFLLNNTPVLSSVSEEIIDIYGDVYNIIDNRKNKTNEQLNEEILKVLIDKKVVTKESAKKLVDKNKIHINDKSIVE